MATTLYVAFSDAKKTTITSVFSCAQPVESFPYQDEMPSDDSRYASYYSNVTELFPNLVGVLVKPGA